MAQRQGIDEAMKVRDQMAWVGTMNMIIAQAKEIALASMGKKIKEECWVIF